jgi:hypothetical protein
MELLIQDFPLTSPQEEPVVNQNVEEPEAPDKTVNEDDKEETLIKSCSIRASVRLDGFNYKMRLRKEESVVKVIDLAIDFSDKSKSNEED